MYQQQNWQELVLIIRRRELTSMCGHTRNKQWLLTFVNYFCPYQPASDKPRDTSFRGFLLRREQSTVDHVGEGQLWEFVRIALHFCAVGATNA